MRPRARAGFTLLEILVAVGVIAVLAGAVMWGVLGTTTTGNTASLTSQLGNVWQALSVYHTDTGRYPPRLDYLTALPASGAVDLCNRPLDTTQIAAWSGPYLERPVLASGLPSGNSMIGDTLTRNPATIAAGPVGTLLISVSGVDSLVAVQAELAYDDAGGSFTSGTIRWTAVGTTHRGTLTYVATIRGC